MISNRTLRTGLATIVSAAGLLAPSAGCAQSRGADSAHAVALLRESATIALALPPISPTRIDLLRRIASAQVAVGDFDYAMRTAAVLGDWRRGVRIGVACRLLEDRRFDDAYRFARSQPTDDREWALAHLASQLAKPPWSTRLGHVDTVDTATLVRRAVDVAGEIRWAHARVDALLSIASSQQRRGDTLGAVSTLRRARAALGDVADSDVVTTRRMMIASGLGMAGRIDEALMILRTLPTREQFALPWSIRGWPGRRDPRVQAELSRLAEVVSRAPDPNVRASMASAVAEALKESGDSALGAAVRARYPAINPKTGKPWVPADVTNLPGSEIEPLARAGNLVGALEAARRIPDPLRVGLRARGYLKLVDAVPSSRGDTVRLALERASLDARGTSLSDPQHDVLLWSIARAQFARGFHDDGLATVKFIHDPVEQAFALYEIAGPPDRQLPMRERYATIARASNAIARERAVVALVGQALPVRPAFPGETIPSPADAAWALAFADSLPPGTVREGAQIAVARYLLARQDSTEARTRLLALLPGHQVDLPRPYYERDDPDELLALLTGLRAVDDAVRWVRTLDAAPARAIGLLTIGSSLFARATADQRDWVSNGPDSCREEF